jgi:hypothetical protein
MQNLQMLPTDLTLFLLNFLDINDLIIYSLLHRNTRMLCHSQLKKYKQQIMFEPFAKFTPKTKHFSIQNNYKKLLEPKIIKIFNHITELFDYIEHFKITNFCLAGSCSIKFLWDIEQIFDDKEVAYALLSKILHHISVNKFLTNVHLGLFQKFIEGNQVLKNQIEQIVQNHPTLMAFEIRDYDKTVFARSIGRNLYKKSTGEIVWQHFAPREIIYSSEDDD